MSNFLKSIGGIGLAAWMGKMRRDSDNEYLDKLRAANNLKPLVHKKTPIDKAFDWVGDKLSSLKKPEFISIPTAHVAPVIAAQTPAPIANVSVAEQDAAPGKIQQSIDDANRIADFEDESIKDAQQQYAAAEDGANSPDKTDTFTAEQFNSAPDVNMVAEQKMNDWVNQPMSE